jgi:tRNA pseudouridine55 synthase
MGQVTGVIVVDKPPYVTSHDVVDAVRAIIGEKKVGHCGTLDPIATGVLVLAIGRATRLTPYLPVDPKEYEGEITFGLETNTYDAMGEVLFEKECTASDDEIIDALSRFTGTFLQNPPLFSAKKVKGKPLYVLARKGIEVEVEPKEVTVYELSVSSIRRERGKAVASFRAVVSKGTYLRSIAHDAGEILGCGGCLTKLRRTRSGVFSLEQAVSLEELERYFSDNRLDRAIITPKDALPNLKTLVVRQGYASRVARGEPIQLRMVRGIKFNFVKGEIVKVVDERGRLISLARWTGDLARLPQDIVARSFMVLV